MSNSRAFLFIVLLLMQAGLLLGADAPLPLGQVQIRIVDATGNALANADVMLAQTERPAGEPEKPTLVKARTDGRGIAHIDYPSGTVRFRVDAVGKGYGATGLGEVLAGKLLSFTIPPLAPYAHITGIIPDAQEAIVTLSGGYGEPPLTIEADKEGRFSTDLHAGTWWARGRRGATTIADSGHSIDLLPGDTVHDLLLKQLTPKEQTASTTFQRSGRIRPADPTMTWVQGILRDETGNPVAGATVYAVATYLGGMRMSERVARATTDVAGHYEIRGEAGLNNFSAMLVAHKPGFVPGRAWFTLPEPAFAEIPDGQTTPTTRAAAPPPPLRDLVLASHGGSLDLVVLHDQKPAANVDVALYLEGAGLNHNVVARSREPVMAEVEEIANPKATTGPDGTAHFTALPPGRYEISASIDGTTADALRQRTLRLPKGAYQIDEAIAVRTDETTTHRMEIYEQKNSIAIQASRHDRTPMTGRIAFDWNRFGSTGGTGSSVIFNAGLGHQDLDAPGLWNVAIRYRESPVRFIPISEPYYSAAAIVAGSPRLTGGDPVQTTAMRFDSGSLLVQLNDVDGKSARGVVEIALSGGQASMIGSTDAQGGIRFDLVRTGQYLVKGYINGVRSPGMTLNDAAPLPTDAQLTGTTFVPWEPARLSANSVAHVTLRARPAGYVRGVIRRPAGDSGANSLLNAAADDTDRGARHNYQRSTGEFIVGPLCAGKTHLHLLSFLPDESRQFLTQEVAVGDGLVTTIEIAPPASTAVPAEGEGVVVQKLPPLGVGSVAPFLAGHVFLDDGKTPAYGATVTYVLGNNTDQNFVAMTDAGGNILINSRPVLPTLLANELVENLPRPVVVTLLPGARGATVVDFKPGVDMPLSITLPKPMRVVGSVTLGGKTLSGQTGRFRVLAAYQGKGKLNGVLSVWATPQNDGSFELAGLTPGNYQVQAALDNIWLSTSIAITADDHPLPPLRLDIGQPGGPALVQCLDAKGSPLRGGSVIVDRPTGPLATLYWPSEFKTDGAGEAWIPALETGKHVAKLKESSAPVEFTIPPLPSSGPAIVKLHETGS